MLSVYLDVLDHAFNNQPRRTYTNKLWVSWSRAGKQVLHVARDLHAVRWGRWVWPLGCVGHRGFDFVSGSMVREERIYKLM
jgi:hypothetical protein